MARGQPDGAGPSERRVHILEAAKVVFAEKGVKQATIREIGARAGVLSGSIYYYFDSKIDLVDAVLRDFCAEVLAGYDVLVSDHARGLDRLQAMARFALSLIGRHAAALVIIQHDSAELVAEDRFGYLVDFNAAVERHWLEAIELGITEGSIRPSLHPPLVYRFARDMVLGVNRWYDPAGPEPLDAVADAFTRLLTAGIGRARP